LNDARNRIIKQPPTVLLAGLVGLVVLIFGLMRVGQVSMWMDEAFSTAAVDQSFGNLLRFLSREVGMMPWYLALWIWSRVSLSDEWLRAFSVVGGATAAFGFVFLARRMLAFPASIFAVAFFLGNQAYLSRLGEARAYSWATCCVVLSTLALLRVMDRPNIGRAALFGVAGGVGAAIHPILLYLFVTQCVFWLVASGMQPDTGHMKTARWRQGAARQHWPIRAVVVAGGIGGLLALPLIALSLRGGAAQIAWIGPLTVRMFRGSIGDLLGGRLQGAAVAILIMVALVVAVRQAVDEGLSFSELLQPIRHVPQSVVFCGVMLVGSISLLLLQSLFVNAFIGRYLSPLTPFVALLAGIGLAAVGGQVIAGRSWRALAVGAGVVLLMGNSLLLAERSRGPDYRTAVDVVPTAAEGTRIVVPRREHWQPLDWYGGADLRSIMLLEPRRTIQPWVGYRLEPGMFVEPLADECRIAAIVNTDRELSQLKLLMSESGVPGWDRPTVSEPRVIAEGLRMYFLDRNGCAAEAD